MEEKEDHNRQLWYPLPCALPFSCLELTSSSSSMRSASVTKLFHNQCFFHTLSIISSIGTFLVSGTRNTTNTDIINTQPAKKKKIPYLKWQSIDRNACATPKVKRRFTHTVTLCPADLVSRGNVSLGINHPRGPHDHAKADTKMHTINTTTMAVALESCWPSCNPVAKRIPITTCNSKQ